MGAFTPYRPLAAEGARIGLMSCLVCGASIVLDPGDTQDMGALHAEWHGGDAGASSVPAERSGRQS